MGLLDVHAEGIQQSVDFDLRNPAPDQPATSFGASSFAAAGFKSLGRAWYETRANFNDLVAAQQAGQINVIEKSDATPEQKATRIADLKKIQADAQATADFSRRRSAEIAPDPITAHRADQVLSNAGTGLLRAATAIGLGGPVAGSLAFGLGEGDTTYHEAIDSGLDHDTALKLAATSGVINAATAGLPAGGPGIKSTIAIATGAGPASYIANEAISRKILQNAGHPDEAAMHDPTDPLGLALSLAIPGVAAGFHIRAIGKAKAPVDVAMDIESQGRRFGKDGQILTSPKGAEGEMQVMPKTQLDPGFGVTPARDHSPEEIARVGREYFGAMQARYPDDTAKAFAAYNAGPGALETAVKEHGADWLAHMPEETQAYVAKAAKKMGDQFATFEADPATVDAARVSIADEALNTHLPDHPDALPELERATEAVSSGRIDIATDAERVRMEAELAEVERQLADGHAGLDVLARHAELTKQLQERPLTSAKPAAEPSPDLSVQAAKPAEVDPHMFVERQPGTAEPKLVEPKEGQGKVEPESLEVQRAQAHMAENPELQVQHPDGRTMRAADLLSSAKAEARHEAGEKELFRAAVQCALSFSG
jgi:hypothetical protein